MRIRACRSVVSHECLVIYGYTVRVSYGDRSVRAYHASTSEDTRPPDPQYQALASFIQLVHSLSIDFDDAHSISFTILINLHHITRVGITIGLTYIRISITCISLAITRESLGTKCYGPGLLVLIQSHGSIAFDEAQVHFVPQQFSDIRHTILDHCRSFQRETKAVYS